MSTCYYDTVTIYTPMKLNSKSLLKKGWRYRPSTIDPQLSYMGLAVPVQGGSTLYLKYFDKSYGQSRLAIQFNIRKLYSGSTDNSLPITNFDLAKLDDRLFSTIRDHIDITLLPNTFGIYKNSRLDNAYDTWVPVNLHPAYQAALSKLSYRNYHKNQYKTTVYLMSSTKGAGSNIVIRIYDKTGQLIAEEVMPLGLIQQPYTITPMDTFELDCQDDHETCLYIPELAERISPAGISERQFRLEVQCRRPKIVYELGKEGKSNTFANALDEVFQIRIINTYLKALHIDASILSIRDMKQHLEQMGLRSDIIRDIITAVRLIRNNRNPLTSAEFNRSFEWLKRYSNTLYDDGNGCSFITTPSLTLPGFKLL